MSAMKTNMTAYRPVCNRFAAMLLFLAVSFSLSAQSKLGFEHYNYIRQSDNAVFVPMFHLQTKNNWYTELRYNYEDAETVSLFAGKTIEGGNKITYTLTPMAGFSIGLFTGVSAGINTEAEWGSFYLSAQSQYSIATKKDISSFFFNWSELGYSISDHVFAGVAMQYTHQEKEGFFEPGLVAGINLKKVSFPIYLFNPFNRSYYFIIGLNYEYNLSRKNK
jgi:hypothetical protein